MEWKPRNEASVWPSLLVQKSVNLLLLFRLCSLFSRQGETEGREEDKGAGEGKGTRKGERRAKVGSWWYFSKLINTGGLIIDQRTGLLFACRKQKELLKALETPEEKRARRLAKIEAKKRKQKEKMGWDQEYMVSLCMAFVSSFVKSCFTIS